MFKKKKLEGDSDTEGTCQGNGITKRHAKLERYGKHVDSIEEELRAWSDILSEREKATAKKRGRFGRWRESKKSGSKPYKTKRER